MTRTGTAIGIGQALRKARLHRGKSLAEASRETRIRSDYLDALEREAFAALPPDVYVRGFLRTYAAYLGLSPDKVMAAYGASFGPPEGTPADLGSRPGFAAEGLVREERHHRRGRVLAVGGAVALLVAAWAFGLLGRSDSVPDSATAPSGVPSVAAAGPGVSLDLVALEDVEVVVIRDGAPPEPYNLVSGEGRSFEATEEIRLRVERANAVDLVVNGYPVGVPGLTPTPYEEVFGPDDYRSPSPGPTQGGVLRTEEPPSSTDDA